MATSISLNQLAHIGIHAPLGATSFHTTQGEIVYRIGDADAYQFERRSLPPDAADRLRKLYNIGGSFGWAITGAGHAVPT